MKTQKKTPFPWRLNTVGITGSGLWTVFTWTALASQITESAAHSFWWLSVNDSLSLVLLLAVVFAWRKDDFRLPHRFDFPLTALMMVASTCLVLLAPSSNGLAFIAASLFGGALFGWLNLRWGEYFHSVDIRFAALNIFVAYGISAFVKYAVNFAPAIVLHAVFIALPLVSVIMLRHASSHSERFARRLARTAVPYDVKPALWKMAGYVTVMVFLITLAKSIAGASRYGSESPLSHIAEIVLAALLILWVFLLKKDLRVSDLWILLLVISLFGLLSETIAYAYNTALLGSSVLMIANSAVVVFSWLVFADISHHSTQSPCAIFGIGCLSYSIPKVVSIVLGHAMYGSVHVAVSAAIIMFLLSLTITFSVNRRDPDLLVVFKSFQKDQPQASTASNLQEKCIGIAERHDLTSREREVAELLYQGRSKAYIAETLFLSENTIRSHARTLYSKCGVHSRNELQRLIDEFERD